MARSISMKSFRDAGKIAQMVAAYTVDPKSDGAKPILLAQVIGEVYSVDEKIGNLPDGSSKISLVARGRFEAMNVNTGETFQGTRMYLPQYYAEDILDALKRNPDGVVQFAAEIIAVPTGKSIPFAYEVQDLIAAPASPLDNLKRALAAKGLLRLPAPPAPDAALPAPTAQAAIAAPVAETAPTATAKSSKKAA